MTVRLFEQELEAATLEQAVDQVLALVGRGGIIVTMNVDHVVLLRRHAGLQEAYRRAAHRYPDGMPIIWLSRLVGAPLPGRVTGADLVPALLAAAELADHSVHVVGGSTQTAIAAAHRVRELHPRLRWTGHEVPDPGFERSPNTDAAVVEAVAAAKPDLVLVCLGAPKQEEWAVRHQESLPGSVLLCTGAAIDFFAGTAARAPRWAQQWGLEWAYRLLREPRRLWRRYLVQDLPFLKMAAVEVRRHWQSKGPTPT